MEIKGEPVDLFKEIKEEAVAVEALEVKPEIFYYDKPSELRTYPRVCLICHEEYRSSKSLVEHSIEVHDEPKPFQCQECTYKTERYDLLTQHSKIHVPGGERECPECGQKFAQKYSLEHHRALKHNVEGTQNIVCQCCGDVFKTYQSYKNHKRSNIPMEPVVCTECGKTVGNKTKLYMHMKNSHPTETFTCEHCGWISKTKGAFKTHQLLGCPKNRKADESLICTRPVKKKSQEGGVCDFCSESVENLRLHTLRLHIRVLNEDGTDLFQCCFCDKSFGRKSTLSHHLLLHTGKPVYKCDICSIEYKEKRSLTKHQETSHGVEPTNKKKIEQDDFNCDQCDFMTNSRKKFEIHLSSTHGVKPFQCHLCDFATAYRNNLRIHISNIHEHKTADLSAKLADIGVGKSNAKNWKNFIEKPKKNPEAHEGDRTPKEPHCEKIEEKVQVNIPTVYMHPVVQNNTEEDKSVENSNETTLDELYCTGESEMDDDDDLLKEIKVEVKMEEEKEENVVHMKQEEIFEDEKTIFEPVKSPEMYHLVTPFEKVQCDKCEKAYFTRKQLLRHQNDVHCNTPCVCEECGKEFRMKHLLRKHVFRQHEKRQIEKGDFPCDVCGRIFETRYKARKHRSDHHHPAKCIPCSLDFENRRQLEKHQNREHKKNSCELCGESFVEYKKLKVHLSRSHGVESQETFCGICKENHHNLPVHHFRVHRIMRSPCPACGKMINSESRLKKHLSHNHKEMPLPSTRDLVIAALQYNGVPENKWPGEGENIMQFCYSSINEHQHSGEGVDQV